MYSINDNEAENHLLKLKTGHKGVSLVTFICKSHELVKEQHALLEGAILDQGECRLTNEYSHLKISPERKNNEPPVCQSTEAVANEKSYRWLPTRQHCTGSIGNVAKTTCGDNTRTVNSVVMLCVQLTTTQVSVLIPWQPRNTRVSFAVFYSGTRKMLWRQM